MKRWLPALLLLWLSLAARGQLPGFSQMPVDIANADQTYFENGIAVAEGNVIIQYGEARLYSDYAEYHPDTHDVLVTGHVRIYREGEIFVGERAVYNLETRQLHAANFQGDFFPFRFSADTISSLGPKAYLVKNSSFTTSDSSIPDYRLRARSARIYPKERIIMRDVTLFVGNTPVFWWPYLYQPLRRDMSYTIRPGFYSEWGFFTLSTWNFPITDTWEGRLHLDYRDKRGAAFGLDSDYHFGPDDRNWGRFRTYFAPDSAPPTVVVGANKDHITHDRYRLTAQDRVYITDDLWASIDINKISDVRMLRDFLPEEYRLDPQPDNDVSLTQWNKDFTASLVVRKQLNTFNDVTEREPDLDFEMTRHAVAEGSNFYVDGETSFAKLERTYANSELALVPAKVSFDKPGKQTFAAPTHFQNYGYNRFDTYYELVYPMEFWKLLSFVPRIGLRGDYYSATGGYGPDTESFKVENLLPNDTVEVKNVQISNNSNDTLRVVGNETYDRLFTNGGKFRGVIDGGFESSFKLSKVYPNVESRALGLDGLMHVVQPFLDVSLAATSLDPGKLLQIDRFQPSTQLPIFQFPQFTGIDTISNWAIAQLGVRNRLETRRDNATFTWLELDTFADVNMKEPTFATGSFRQGILSNLYNNLAFSPVPWFGLSVNAQTPVNHHGFNEVDTSANYMFSKDLQVTLGHRYLDHNPFFASSSLVDSGIYYRLGDNWSLSAREEYEFADSTLETQTYSLHRDLSSWVASLGVEIENNGPGSSPHMLYALLFTMTLKDMPAVSIPFSVDPANVAGKNP